MPAIRARMVDITHQEDVRDIVAYAAKQHITVIPEIEMPGHSNEVFAGISQPHL